ncbi:hypothetical protein [Geodermatophilus sp. URMC 63]
MGLTDVRAPTWALGADALVPSGTLPELAPSRESPRRAQVEQWDGGEACTCAGEGLIAPVVATTRGSANGPDPDRLDVTPRPECISPSGPAAVSASSETVAGVEVHIAFERLSGGFPPSAGSDPA